jgi:prepilin peptidase CpaA
LFNCLLVLFCALSVSFDIVERRIPNWLVLSGIVWGGSFSAWNGLSELLNSFLGFGLGVIFLLLPFALGWTGAGDVKMLGAVGAILGAELVPRVFFYTALFGLIMAVVVIAGNRLQLGGMKTLWSDVKMFIATRGVIAPQSVAERASKGNVVVPYGVAIAAGTLIAYFVDAKGEWAGF